jgi:hypothetical protein
VKTPIPTKKNPVSLYMQRGSGGMGAHQSYQRTHGSNPYHLGGGGGEPLDAIAAAGGGDAKTRDTVARIVAKVDELLRVYNDTRKPSPFHPAYFETMPDEFWEAAMVPFIHKGDSMPWPTFTKKFQSLFLVHNSLINDTEKIPEGTQSQIRTLLRVRSDHILGYPDRVAERLQNDEAFRTASAQLRSEIRRLGVSFYQGRGRLDFIKPCFRSLALAMESEYFETFGQSLGFYSKMAVFDGITQWLTFLKKRVNPVYWKQTIQTETCRVLEDNLNLIVTVIGLVVGPATLKQELRLLHSFFAPVPTPPKGVLITHQAAQLDQYVDLALPGHRSEVIFTAIGNGSAFRSAEVVLKKIIQHLPKLAASAVTLCFRNELVRAAGAQTDNKPLLPLETDNMYTSVVGIAYVLNDVIRTYEDDCDFTTFQAIWSGWVNAQTVCKLMDCHTPDGPFAKYPYFRTAVDYMVEHSSGAWRSLMDIKQRELQKTAKLDGRGAEAKAGVIEASRAAAREIVENMFKHLRLIVFADTRNTEPQGPQPATYLVRYDGSTVMGTPPPPPQTISYRIAEMDRILRIDEIIVKPLQDNCEAILDKIGAAETAVKRKRDIYVQAGQKLADMADNKLVGEHGDNEYRRLQELEQAAKAAFYAALDQFNLNKRELKEEFDKAYAELKEVVNIDFGEYLAEVRHASALIVRLKEEREKRSTLVKDRWKRLRKRGRTMLLCYVGMNAYPVSQDVEPPHAGADPPTGGSGHPPDEMERLEELSLWKALLDVVSPRHDDVAAPGAAWFNAPDSTREHPTQVDQDRAQIMEDVERRFRAALNADAAAEQAAQAAQQDITMATATPRTEQRARQAAMNLAAKRLEAKRSAGSDAVSLLVAYPQSVPAGGQQRQLFTLRPDSDLTQVLQDLRDHLAPPDSDPTEFEFVDGQGRALNALPHQTVSTLGNRSLIRLVSRGG